MAQHKSALKRIRSTSRRNITNSALETKLRTLIKKLRNETKKDSASKLLVEVVSFLDTLARKGVIHRNKAANQKSKLTKKVSALK